jgi:CheY-like chemotaxis protein
MNSQSATVFLVEDNEADVYLLRLILNRLEVRCELVVFENGETAMEFITRSEEEDSTPPENHMFIIDLNLPRVDGRTLLKHLRDHGPFRESPVIVWTSSDAPRDPIESAALGANRHVCKPPNLEAFMAFGGVVKDTLFAQRV